MILDVDNLTIRFPFGRELRPVVRGVSFQVAPGEILGVVGESGCGKSITNLAVLGLLPPGAQVTADRFALCGQDLLAVGRRDWPTVRGSKVAMIFQNPMSALNPSLTIGTQLIESVRKADPALGRRQREARAIELLEQVGIGAAALRLKSYPHELSGGMAQRAMIAMALASRPALLIADEPTTALDVTIQAQILDLLDRLRRDNGMSVILVSHDIGVVQQYADRIQVMYSGEIVETGPIGQVTQTPSHPYTRALLQSLPGRVGARPKTPLVTIRGMVPPIELAIEGCRFASRCDRAEAQCQDRPPVARRTADSWVRCHL
ncbi:ABC transporter ATP-binding protein [Chitinimonas lacunae]|uniref:ABC transporter ATP-binding protein n=1 Tax=Chitinimonas lacunae TaxID=1963018 RepID=A0ABV8MSJ3_9NEIS